MAARHARKQPRSRAKLEADVAQAETPDAKAEAHFELAVFHDNNSREREAIPHYEAARKLGLADKKKAQCLAWLASSLFKTGKLDKAEARLEEARAATSDAELMSFLRRLDRRLSNHRFDIEMRATANLLGKLARSKPYKL